MLAPVESAPGCGCSSGSARRPSTSPRTSPSVQLSEMRAASSLPIDLYVESPDALGGVVRGNEIGDLIAGRRAALHQVRAAQLARPLPLRRAPRGRGVLDRPREGASRGRRPRVAPPPRARARAVRARTRPAWASRSPRHNHPDRRREDVPQTADRRIGGGTSPSPSRASRSRGPRRSGPRSSRSGTTTAPRATRSRPGTSSRPSRRLIRTSRSRSSASRPTTTSRCCSPQRSRTRARTCGPCGRGCSTSSTRSSCST